MLLPWASALPAAAALLRERLDRARLEESVASVPDVWLAGGAPFPEPAGHRAAYVAHLARRLEAADLWLSEAERARAHLV